MRVLALAVITACASPRGPAATSPAPPVPRPVPAPPCEARVVSYRDWPQLEAAGNVAWALDLAAPGGGRLRYLGAEHSDDPAHSQFAAIDRAWAEVRPTVAFYEGPDRPVADTREATIRSVGESGYVRFLARRDGVAFERLDPDPRDELRHVRARHPAAQVALFYVLREVARLRERKGVPRDQLDAAVTAMLAQARQRGLDGLFADLGALEAAYREHLGARAGAPADWRDAPTWWFDPLPRDDELFTHRINRASSEFRDRHMVRVLAARARAGARVLAVVGKHHVPMQARALRCALAAR